MILVERPVRMEPLEHFYRFTTSHLLARVCHSLQAHFAVSFNPLWFELGMISSTQPVNLQGLTIVPRQNQYGK